jgi:hypothetical protein
MRKRVPLVLEMVVEVPFNTEALLDFLLEDNQRERVFIRDVGLDDLLQTTIEIAACGFQASKDRAATKAACLYMMRRNSQLRRSHWILEEHEDGSSEFKVSAYMFLETMNAEDFALKVSSVANECNLMCTALEDGSVVL